MELKVEKVTNKFKDKKKIKEILKYSFSKEELMPFFMMILMSKMDSTDFLAFYDNEILCGFTYMATYNSTTFIIYLAVNRELRSRGYGSKILNKIEKMYSNNKLVLFIDRCDLEKTDNMIRNRRKRFYLTNGYKETNYLIDSTKEFQEILIKNGEFNKEEFLQFMKKYSNGTMKCNIIQKH